MPSREEKIRRLQYTLALVQRELMYLVEYSEYNTHNWTNAVWDLLEKEELILDTLKIYEGSV